MYKIGETEMICCPYNRYHVVSKLRIQKHLVKCQKNHPDVKLATCFYNYSHRLKPEDMLKHYEICSRKTRIEASRYCESNNLQDSHFIENNDPYKETFPDINSKPVFFTNPVKLSSSSNPSVINVKDRFDSSNSGSESDYHLAVSEDIPDFSGDDSEDVLEPLPLPKTVSKAFVCAHQSAGKFFPQTFPCKKFGRGKNFLGRSSRELTKSSVGYLPVESVGHSINEELKFSSKCNIASIKPSMLEFDYILKSEPEDKLKSSSTSVRSSILDHGRTLKSESQLLSHSSTSITPSLFLDDTTLKSGEIIFEDFNEEDKSEDSF